MEIKRYADYIDSREPWLGNVPSEWNMILLSQLVTPVKNKNTDLKEQNLLSLSYGKIKRKSIDSTGGLLPESFDGYNIIEANDIVLRLTDLQNDHTSLRVALATEKGIITSAYTTLRPRNPKSAKFLYYLIHSFDIQKGFYGMGSGVRQGLNYDEVKKLKLPIPSLDEQTAIAAFLDIEIERIDSIIAEAKTSIEEYKEWKASIIYEAVTKGLDPNVEMKDSGIKWIGKIPVHWKCTKARQVSTFINGYAFQSDDFSVDGIYPVIRIGDIQDGKVDFLSCQSVSSNEGISSAKIEKNDILLAMSGATVGKVGYVDDVPLNRAYINQRVGIYRVKETPKFFFYLFSQPSYIEYALLNASGSAQPNISTESAKNFFVPIPPLDERERICQYLEKKRPYIEGIIVEKQSLISDLEAYKKSLIFEVVTGKRKVV